MKLSRNLAKITLLIIPLQIENYIKMQKWNKVIYIYLHIYKLITVLSVIGPTNSRDVRDNIWNRKRIL